MTEEKNIDWVLMDMDANSHLYFNKTCWKESNWYEAGLWTTAKINVYARSKSFEKTYGDFVDKLNVETPKDSEIMKVRLDGELSKEQQNFVMIAVKLYNTKKRLI